MPHLRNPHRAIAVSDPEKKQGRDSILRLLIPVQGGPRYRRLGYTLFSDVQRIFPGPKSVIA